MIARTSYGDLPRALVEELADAGLDPRAVYEMVVAAFDEDLPDGSRDVTSAAMPPMGHGIGDIAAREAGVVAGLGVGRAGLRLRPGSEVEVDRPLRDGSRSPPATS